jgi:hypothetical protein
MDDKVKTITGLAVASAFAAALGLAAMSQSASATRRQRPGEVLRRRQGGR